MRPFCAVSPTVAPTVQDQVVKFGPRTGYGSEKNEKSPSSSDQDRKFSELSVDIGPASNNFNGQYAKNIGPMKYLRPGTGPDQDQQKLESLGPIRTEWSED